MHKPEMIIFDYGGTILFEPDFDFLRGEKAVFEHVVKNPLNKSAEDVNDFNTRIFSDSKKARDVNFELHHFQMLKMKYEGVGIDLDIDYSKAEEILWDNISPMSEKCCMPYVCELLEFLEKKEIRSGVISNMGWSGNALKRRINSILPQNKFEFIIASSEYGYRKPEKELFNLALLKAGLGADKVWFCGDTFDTDITGAHGAGMFPVFYDGTVEGGPVRKSFYEVVQENRPDFEFLHVSDFSKLIKVLDELD